MKSLRGSVFGAGAVASAIIGWSCRADASGFATQRFGGEQGSVVATNPTALYYNPGAIGFSKGWQFGLYGSLALRRLTWTHAQAGTPGDAGADVPDPTKDPTGHTIGPATANTGEARALNAFGGPALGGSFKFGNLVVGAGFFAPFFGNTRWDQNNTLSSAAKTAYPLAADGVQRWFGIYGAIQVLYFTAGAAYRIGPISIGASGNFISSSIDTTQAKNTTGQGIARTDEEGRAVFHADGFNGSFGVGAMAELVPDQLWLGGSYQSQPGLGAQNLKGTLDLTQGTQMPIHYALVFTQSLPDVYRAGVRWHPKHTPVEFRLFGDFTRWSLLTTQCAALVNTPCAVNTDYSDPSKGGVLFNFRRGWNDTYGGRLGVSYWVDPAVELFVGTGYETAAVPDSTMGPDLTDAPTVEGALGARFGITDTLFISVGYTHLQSLNRDTTGKSTLAVLNGQVIPVPTYQPDGGGQYTQWVGVFNGNLEALF